MKQTRNNVFETNSSSTHSISISKTNDISNDIFLNIKYDRISIQFDEFGWEECKFNDCLTKFKYICSMWWMLESYNFTSLNDILNSAGYKIIENAIIEFFSNNENLKRLKANHKLLNIKGLIIDEYSNINIRTSYDNILRFECSAYIDHQSVPYRKVNDEYINYTLEEWLKENNITAMQFIFDNECVLITGNDNEY